MAGYQKEILPSSWSPKSRLCNSNMQCSSNSGFSAGGGAAAPTAPSGYATGSCLLSLRTYYSVMIIIRQSP